MKERLVPLPITSQRKVLGENAIRFYKLKLVKHEVIESSVLYEKCTVRGLDVFVLFFH